jgi:hypothetical protein
MSRPEFVTNEDVARWSDNIDNDSNLSEALTQNPIIRELCFAGLWLGEELQKLECPDEMIVRIQYTAGKLSFGRDPWETHQKTLESYKLNELEYESESKLTELN